MQVHHIPGHDPRGHRPAAAGDALGQGRQGWEGGGRRAPQPLEVTGADEQLVESAVQGDAGGLEDQGCSGWVAKGEQ